MKINLEKDKNKEKIESGDLVAFVTTEGQKKIKYYRLVAHVKGQFTLLDPKNLTSTCGSYYTVDGLVKALNLVLIAKAEELELRKIKYDKDNK